jgi:hypothetical protein
MTLTRLPAQDDLQPWTEQVADWRGPDLEVDCATRMVRNIVLSGGDSRNGHRYSEQALRDAAGLYVRKPVFLDHAANPARPHERSTRDLVGAIAAARYEQGRLRGDVQVLDTEAGRTFLALLQGDSPAVGMSHVVLAQRGSDPTAIERIHDVVSVDAVVFPATTRGFREVDHTTWQGSFETIIEAIDRQLPAAVQQATGALNALVRRAALFEGWLIAECQRPEGEPQRYAVTWKRDGDSVFLQVAPEPLSVERLQEQLTARRSAADQTLEIERLRQERDAARQQLADWADERLLNGMLAAAALPAEAVTPAFREQLKRLTDPAQRQAWIAERAALCRRTASPSVLSHSRAPHGPRDPLDPQFIRAIRGDRLGVLNAAGG